MRRFKFAWWNTSLSPLAMNRSKPDEKELAFEVIYYLLKEVRINCLALGEVSSEDISDFFSRYELLEYAYYDGNVKAGKLQFDTGLIYRKEDLFLNENRTLVDSHGGKSFKVANYLEFTSPIFSKPLHIFISHWSSRITYGKNSTERTRMANHLREEVDKINKQYNNSAYTVLLGDYNDEPFDISLSEILLASRDRQLVRKRPNLLYNPFWRHLGEPAPHVPGKQLDCYSGTCFYSAGNETQWRTFDQIIFSSTFLGYDGWQLDEEDTLILRLSKVNDCIAKAKSIFDHFPVISVIERKDIF